MLGKKNAEVKISTLLGADSECVGNFSAKGSARLDGRVNGDVTVAGDLIVGATGFVRGNITANAVMIGGEVQGDISAPEKTELTETAKVFGDIATGVIVIDENAVFQGKIDMNREMPEKKAKTGARAARAGKKSAKAAIAEALKEVEAAAAIDEAADADKEAEASEKETKAASGENAE